MTSIKPPMSIAEAIIIGMAAAANTFAAAVDFARVQWILDNMTRYGVPRRWLPVLGAIKTAGALGGGLRSAGARARDLRWTRALLRRRHRHGDQVRLVLAHSLPRGVPPAGRRRTDSDARVVVNQFSLGRTRSRRVRE
jgi:hypothetical protein